MYMYPVWIVAYIFVSPLDSPSSMDAHVHNCFGVIQVVIPTNIEHILYVSVCRVMNLGNMLHCMYRITINIIYIYIFMKMIIFIVNICVVELAEGQSN